MHIPTAKILLCILALTVAVPESYARRLGSGRSVGRQTQFNRQRVDPIPQRRPSPPVSNPQFSPAPRTLPDYSRQPSSPSMPQPVPRQASRPWGGMFGGALLGLGLGSLLSSNDRNNAANQSNANRNPSDPNPMDPSSGASTAGTSAAGNGDTGQTAALPAEQSHRGPFGSFLWFGLLALGAYFLLRKLRRRR